MVRIKDLISISSRNSKKLLDFGIATTERLLLVAAHKLGREDLSKHLDISEEKILEWINLADLIRIRGIGGEYCYLLEKIGVDSLSELRKRNAKELYRSIVEINREQYIVRRLPSPRDVDAWVKQSKRMHEVVTY